MADNINLLNEKLKAKEAAEANKNVNENEPMKLDDAARVKVLSPARLVAKRFFRNKLAIVGLVLLITLFAFSFLGPLVYPYGQTQKFTNTKFLDLEYAVSGIPSSYDRYMLDEDQMKDVENYIDSFIIDLNKEGVNEKVFEKFNEKFKLVRIGESLYSLSKVGGYIGKIDTQTGTISGGNLSEEANAKILEAYAARQETVTVNDVEYKLVYGSKSQGTTLYADYDEADIKEGMLASKLVFDKHSPDSEIDEQFKLAALRALYADGQFSIDGKEYTISEEEGESLIKDAAGNVLFGISQYSITEANGQDTLSIDFKKTFTAVVEDMEEAGVREGQFTYKVPQIDPETLQYVYDEDGNIELHEETLSVVRKETAGEVRYYAKYNRLTEVYAAYMDPSSEHLLGTDQDGFDVLARVMYGGRISLMVGFVVVILETILGVIMGGIAGFFGGWVDTLIMRLVDIFYCIPTMPIMIIIASVFDKLKMPPYERLMWMMAMLGVLGWSGIARLVRGQILSLREQEFMTAAEATGLKTSRRIFKHLVPNVMPQLIVSMTMGLGSVILLESTLSYLGLGVKHPLATWGNIINSVSSIDAMKEYTYIWIPVGVLICLAVIAFNFVGDGLRDAFDPKMKR